MQFLINCLNKSWVSTELRLFWKVKSIPGFKTLVIILELSPLVATLRTGHVGTYKFTIPNDTDYIPDQGLSWSLCLWILKEIRYWLESWCWKKQGHGETISELLYVTYSVKLAQKWRENGNRLFIGLHIDMLQVTKPAPYTFSLIPIMWRYAQERMHFKLDSAIL